MASVTAVLAAFLVLTTVGLLVLALRLRRSSKSPSQAPAVGAERVQHHVNQRELDLLKQDFVSLVSYELRTPLTSIRGYLDLIRDDEEWLSPQHAAFFEVISRNTDRLQALIGDLLFVAQVEAGQASLDWDNVDMTEIVSEAVDDARPFASAQDIGLDLMIDPEIPLVGDRDRLAQTVSHLLSNALKFTPAGGRVSVTATEEGGRARLVVSDTGIGIAERDRDRVFERFYRTAAATKSAISGAGLGLAIVKAIVEAHEGTVGVESDAGSGSTFTVTLPAAAGVGLSLEEAAA